MAGGCRGQPPAPGRWADGGPGQGPAPEAGAAKDGSPGRLPGRRGRAHPETGFVGRPSGWAGGDVGLASQRRRITGSAGGAGHPARDRASVGQRPVRRRNHPPRPCRRGRPPHVRRNRRDSTRPDDRRLRGDPRPEGAEFAGRRGVRQRPLFLREGHGRLGAGRAGQGRRSARGGAGAVLRRRRAGQRQGGPRPPPDLGLGTPDAALRAGDSRCPRRVHRQGWTSFGSRGG
jgi:hypothetical protein